MVDLEEWEWIVEEAWKPCRCRRAQVRDRSCARRPGSPIVPAGPNGSSEGAEQGENDADDEEDEANRVQDRDGGEDADQDENNSERDHDVSTLVMRPADCWLDFQSSRGGALGHDAGSHGR